MKTIIEMKYAIIALIMTVVCGAGAQASAPWTVNPSDYQYDMSLYLKVVFQDAVPMDYSHYTVAAFCGNECRGIAEVQTHTDGSTWLYLRARSNSASGETLTYKYYSEETGKIANIEDVSFDFVSQSQVGWPSSPELVTIVPPAYTPGDVNGDGEINPTDITYLISYYLGSVVPGFVEAAADLNGDNEVTPTDVTLLIQLYINN